MRLNTLFVLRCNDGGHIESIDVTRPLRAKGRHHSGTIDCELFRFREQRLMIHLRQALPYAAAAAEC